MVHAPTRRAVAVLAVAFAASIPFAAISATAAHAAPQWLDIFAVGDSYASGEGAIGSGWTDPSCHKSALAAPQQAAIQLSSQELTNFTSLACSGSVIEDPSGQTDAAHRLLGPSGQLSQVGSPGELVDALTISIGGNDIGFSGIVKNCMIPFHECEDDPTVIAPLAVKLPGVLWGELTHLVNAVQGPGRLVPADVRDVFVTEYPDPTTGVWGTRCGDFWAPAFEGFDGISESEAQWASQQLIAPLNGILQAAVNAANNAPGSHPTWHFVTGISRAFATHGYCAGSPSPNPADWSDSRWINTPIDSLVSQGDTNGSMHPNAAGQGVIAGILAQNMKFLVQPGVRVPVPRLYGSTPQQARSVLRSAGFTVGFSSVPDATCNNIGIVLTESPSPSYAALQGSMVTVGVGVRPKNPCP